MKKRFKYTAGQVAFLRTGYPRMSIHDLTGAFNRRFELAKTASEIQSTLKNHRIRCGRKGKDRLISQEWLFTVEQIAFVRENYAGRSRAEMTKVFNRHFETDMTVAQITTCVHNRGITSGRTGRFPKGNKPWNAGTSGQGLTGANKGSFKKGSIPPNRKSLGTERICPKDGYLLIKVAEKNPYTGFPTRYKHKHVHIWEQENGPVPKGVIVALRDGDKINCEPENLMLITRAELLNLNRHGYKDMPDKLKPSVLALSKLQVKTWAKEKL